MSAIKNIGLKLSAPVLLLLIFFSCDYKKSENIFSKKPNEIISIKYSEIGGELGNYKIVEVTKDSIHMETGSTHTKAHKEWKSKNTPQIWNRLTSTLDVRTLDKIKSSPSQQSVDGIDETFQIRTPKKYHAYVNAYVDTIYYKQLQKLKDQILNILP
ncbi:hypothetical protein SAMN05880574_10794 [Chryseobacterium sp. RU37D]|uniref:hypothetical protein n=1 Tax=Chryseobacterium sp. RU37D TaxID=1907397 RepID=UPI00095716F6|nr:hypothetical protein [Chryseobacterium sp. RU37D]SIQ19673.1 hypothetical protein SAMN05880574_10794 [Chryseobacterium sp. RU37D]